MSHRGMRAFETRRQYTPLEQGFTVVELLVSLTVMSVIIGLLGGGLRVLSSSIDTKLEDLETLDMQSRAFDILRRDIAGFQRIPLPDGGDPHYLFAATAQTLTFITFEPPYPLSAGAYIVRYRVISEKNQYVLVRTHALFRRSAALGDQSRDLALDAQSAVDVLRGPFPYRFSYAARDVNGGAWTKDWTNRARLPERVRLEVSSAKDGDAHMSSFVFPIRADAELTCLDQTADLCSPRSNGVLMSLSARSQTPGASQELGHD